MSVSLEQPEHTDKQHLDIAIWHLGFLLALPFPVIGYLAHAQKGVNCMCLQPVCLLLPCK